MEVRRSQIGLANQPEVEPKQKPKIEVRRSHRRGRILPKPKSLLPRASPQSGSGLPSNQRRRGGLFKEQQMDWSCRALGHGLLVAHHHLNKFLVVDLPVAIDVRRADHLVDLLVRQLLAEVRHHVAYLGGADGATAITLVERFDIEPFPDFSAK